MQFIYRELVQLLVQESSFFFEEVPTHRLGHMIWKTSPFDSVPTIALHLRVIIETPDSGATIWMDARRSFMKMLSASQFTSNQSVKI